MKNPMNLRKLSVLMSLLMATFSLSRPAVAQWWRFGSDDTVPVFTDLVFNKTSALQVDRRLELGRSDLESGGRVIVRGRTEIGQGSIGRVEASLDGGATWMAIPFAANGLFALEFVPETGKDYGFAIRAFSTSGKASGDGEHAFVFSVSPHDETALAKAAFLDLLDRYMAEDRAGFMRMVSDDFAGNASALDGALSDDFRAFDAIRITPTIQRITAQDGRFSISFAFTRQVRSARTGQMLKDASSTIVVLQRGEAGFHLVEMAAPLIFGLSDAENVASFVNDGAIGDTVIVVDDNGNAATGEQGQDIAAESGSGGTTVESAQMVVAPHPPIGFTFSTGAVQHVVGDFLATGGDAVNGLYIWPSAGVVVADMGFDSIDGVTEAPAAGYGTFANLYLVTGRLYAFLLADSTYALIEVTGIDDSDPANLVVDFDYRYQPDGSRNF